MSGRQSALLVTRMGHRKAFQEAMKASRVTVSITGRLMGITTDQRKRRWVAPSMRAASHRSKGMPAKNWRIRKMLTAFAMNGTVSEGNWLIQEPPGSGKV